MAVKRSGANTAKPNEPTELVQFLVQRLRDNNNGDDVIPKMTAFEAGKKTKIWRDGSEDGTGSSLSSSSFHSCGGGGDGGGGGGGSGASSLSAGPPSLPMLQRLPPLPSRGGAAAEKALPNSLLCGTCKCQLLALPLPLLELELIQALLPLMGEVCARTSASSK